MEDATPGATTRRGVCLPTSTTLLLAALGLLAQRLGIARGVRARRITATSQPQRPDLTTPSLHAVGERLARLQAKLGVRTAGDAVARALRESL